MAKKRDWSAIVQSNSEQSREDAKSKFKDARVALSSLPENVMQPKGDSSFQMETINHYEENEDTSVVLTNQEKESKSFQVETFKASLVSSNMNLESLALSEIDVMGVMVSVDLLKSNPFNARYYYDDSVIDLLADSLLNDGQKQSVLITNDPENIGLFIIIDGEYRFRACKSANMGSLRCDFYPNVTKEELYYVSNLVNERRTAQTVFDNAKAWQNIINEGVVANAAEVALLVKKNASIVSKTLSLNLLDESVAKILSLSEKRIGLAIAYEFSLLAKSIDFAKSLEIAQRIANGELTIKDIEKLKKTLAVPPVKNKKELDYNKSFVSNGKRVGGVKIAGGKINLSISATEDKQELFIKDLEDLILKHQIGEALNEEGQ